MLDALRNHWPEYLMEAALLGLFMLSASFFGSLLEHPASPLHQSLPDSFARGVLMGLAMAATAVTLIYSRWGARSGAHFNPAVTLNFYLLGKVARWDAVFYTAFQFAGGILGMVLASAVLRPWLGHPSVNYVMTKPGAAGVLAAFTAEVFIAAVQMTVVLAVSNQPRLARFTGVAAAAMVALYITFERHLSGMSLNPARSFGSAAAALDFADLWVYFIAPPLGMFLGARLYAWRRGAHRVFCAKLHHHNHERCIFRCGHTTGPL